MGYYGVIATIHHTDQIVTELIIAGEWIETTPERPFYVEGKGWVDAEDLETGDQVRQADGTTGIVWLQWNIHKTQEMYNLTVDTAHTFFVGDGQWLVHNTSCPIGPYIEEGGHHIHAYAKRLEPKVTSSTRPYVTPWAVDRHMAVTLIFSTRISPRPRPVQ